MHPRILEKIRAVASDPRGDPRTREIAQRMLAEHERPPPPPPEPPRYNSRIHPGLEKTPEFIRFKFMSLDNWGRTKNGNLIHTTSIKGREYKIVLFSHKKTPTYGWMQIDPESDTTVFSDTKYATMIEAHQAAWQRLMIL